jgi:hypothetical protein
VDRNDWIQLSELQEGERLQAANGVAIVVSVAIVNTNVPVYNIEVHGEHVYQVGDCSLLVHNSCNPLRGNMIANGEVFAKGEQAAHIVPRRGWKWADAKLKDIIKAVDDVGLLNDVKNGFKATAGHTGTHTKDYVTRLIKEMHGLTDMDDIKKGLDTMRDLIAGGTFT